MHGYTIRHEVFRHFACRLAISYLHNLAVLFRALVVDLEWLSVRLVHLQNVLEASLTGRPSFVHGQLARLQVEPRRQVLRQDEPGRRAVRV